MAGQQEQVNGGVRGRPHVLQGQASQPLPDIPRKNFAVFMLEELAAHPGDTVALENLESRQQRKYSELCDLVPRVAAGLAAAGVGLGDKVLVYSQNDLDIPLVTLSILHCGATVVPISPVFASVKEELTHCVNVSEARWAVVQETLLAQVEMAFSLLPHGTIRKVWVLGTAGERPSITDLMTYDPMPPVTEDDGLDPARHVAILPFSSGSTGPRKGVLITHEGEIARRMSRKYWVSAISPEEELATCLLGTLMTHAFSFLIIFDALSVGGTILFRPNPTFKNFIGDTETFKVSMANLLPSWLKELSDLPDLQEHDLSSLKVITSAGMTLSDTIAKAVKEKMDATLRHLLGMTEVGYMTDGLVTEYHKGGAVGKLVPYVEIKVIDVDSREMLGVGQSGELAVRGPTTLLGYSNNPTTKDLDGWLLTGDYGYYDQENFIYVTGRLKNLMKVDGYQVSPYDLECVLMQHPQVAEAVVVGVPDERMGELPRAYVTLTRGSDLQPLHLQQFVEERVTKMKRLRGGIWILDAIPKTSNGKIFLRQLLRGEVTPLATTDSHACQSPAK